MSRFLRKILLIALPAFVAAGLLSAALVEVWVRARWDETRGTPGFYLSDPVLGQRLAPGYRGWFAGVPVTINSLGFRDDRDYALAKAPGTFRIIVLGDSVTFGHGTLSSTTYPFLLEQRLKAWRPAVKWEVWNLGVPGYNTSQELAYLREVGDRYAPDLVIVGFYPNDFTANEKLVAPSMVRRVVSAIQRTMQKHLYSYEFYRSVYLTARWRFVADAGYREQMNNLAGEEALLNRASGAADSAAQQLTKLEFFGDDDVRGFTCPSAGRPDARDDRMRNRYLQQSPEVASWADAVKELQQLNRDGRYRLMFFVNMAPQVCDESDRFYDGGIMDDDALLNEVLGNGTPVVSSAPAYLHYRPSQMPAAGGHAIGNANVVKADVLFKFLSERLLPPLLTPP